MKYPANIIWNCLRHNWCKFLLLGCLAAPSADALAVTEEEMDRAKAIAAKTYIRFVNNNSGYLDDFTPSSMADLENYLTNDKDRGHLKDFQKGAVASDYASWGKDKLAEYWSTTFFQNNQAHLDSKAANNGLAKVRIMKAISNMKVTEPSAKRAQASKSQTKNNTKPQASQKVQNVNLDPLDEYRVDKLEEEDYKIVALNMQDWDSYEGYKQQLEKGNQTIQDLESEIANVNTNLAMYRATVIKYASDLLNIPYDEYTVTEIAIPILKNAVNAGPRDDSASAKLSLLENYNTNVQQLKNLLNSYINAINNAKTPEEFIEWTELTYVKFKYEEVVKAYKKVYPKDNDLKKTYLGSIISIIESQLANRGNPDAKATMLKTFTDLKRQLK